MSKRAEELAKQLYPDPKLEDYDDILVYRANRDNAIMERLNVIRAYEQAEKDLGWHPSAEHPPVDEEVIVLADIITKGGLNVGFGRIAFGHIVDKSVAIDYNGWNIPGVRLWMPMPEIPKEK